MKASLILPCRDKEKHVKRAIQSALNQTHPCEILISDQGSEDRTPDIIWETMKDYRGPHSVRFLQCPHAHYKGMPGLNKHIDWLCEQAEGEIILIGSADDVNHHERVARTITSYEENKPLMVVAKMLTLDPDLTYKGETAYPKESRFVEPQECYDRLVGGSSCPSFRRDFWERVKPLEGVLISDVYMALLAAFAGGLYYLNEALYAYIDHADEKNTGLQGVSRALPEKQRQINEIFFFQMTRTLYRAKEALQQNDWGTDEQRQWLINLIFAVAYNWMGVREELTLNRIDPMAMRA